MLKKQIIKIINEIKSQKRPLIKEFMDDIKKQAIVMMGLPASGKSTFIKTDLKKYIPQVTTFNIANSDNQVVRLQYQTAQKDFNELNNHIQSGEDINTVVNDFVSNTVYVNNSGEKVIHPLTREWLKQNKGFNNFWKAFYKPYYATYFDIRDMAKEIDKNLFKDKIYNASNIVIIDTVGASPESVEKKLSQLKKAGFYTTIIYLEIDPNLTIIRDKYRQKTQGRGVGEDVIFGYASKIDAAYNHYKQIVGGDLLDRLIHLTWQPEGNHPVKGDYVFNKESKYITSNGKRVKIK